MKKDEVMGLMIGFLSALLCIQLAGCGEVTDEPAVELQQSELTCGTVRGIPAIGVNKTISPATAYWNSNPVVQLSATPSIVQNNSQSNKIERGYFGSGDAAWNVPKFCAGHWDLGLWSSPNAPVPGALAPGPNGQCYVYYRTTDGLCAWADDSQTTMQTFAYKVFPAAPNSNGVKWIEQLDLPNQYGNLIVKGQVH